ncbi:MAG: hypothetical protein ABIG68_04940, partial [Acidobacteriota bacterium]
LVTDCIALFSREQERGCTANVHLLGHSAGAFVIREAFDDADDRASIASRSWSVSQVAFIAGDIDRQRFPTRTTTGTGNRLVLKR